MREILTRHIQAHPYIQPRDMIKLCYQAVFGAEHLLTDESRVRAYFENEWTSTPAAAGTLWEAISDGYARVNLAAWKAAALPAEWLFRMFWQTASHPRRDHDASTLPAALDTVGLMASEKQLPFSEESWCMARAAYEELGGGAVHHSEQYRAAEQPSYRVIDRRYLTWIPLLRHLAAMPKPTNRPTVIAIDGRAASGKSTLAQSLADILDAGIVHMDDFFLPPTLRTPDRLAEAGGNVHYERFAEQILPRLRHNDPFTYTAFDCSKMCLDGEVSVKNSSWRIVEGSYSHHPKLGDYMDLRLFCQVSSQEQMRRILARNGAAMAEMFALRWIPMEERYFEAYGIAEKADIRLNNEFDSKENSYEIND